jgi:hypothetical protein
MAMKGGDVPPSPGRNRAAGWVLTAAGVLGVIGGIALAFPALTAFFLLRHASGTSGRNPVE